MCDTYNNSCYTVASKSGFLCPVGCYVAVQGQGRAAQLCRDNCIMTS